MQGPRCNKVGLARSLMTLTLCIPPRDISYDLDIEISGLRDPPSADISRPQVATGLTDVCGTKTHKRHKSQVPKISHRRVSSAMHFSPNRLELQRQLQMQMLYTHYYAIHALPSVPVMLSKPLRFVSTWAQLLSQLSPGTQASSAPDRSACSSPQPRA